MYSDDCEYIGNVFRNNGAGVAVMYTKRVHMVSNRFEKNWGSSAYGLLLKEIADSRIERNVFEENTTGLYADGADRIRAIGNDFNRNGWAVRVGGSTLNGLFTANNFVDNTFDVTTNSQDPSTKFEGNYWSSYKGYDLDRNGIGDVPHAPVRLFAVIVERNPIDSADAECTGIDSRYGRARDALADSSPVRRSKAGDEEARMIRIRNLRKRFGSLDVLQGIDADVATGRVTGIVGPNAAGKTTLIKSILGLTRPDSGTLEVAGVKVNGDERYRSRIGYMPQIAKFPSNLTGAELLAMLRELRPDVKEPDEDLIRSFGLGLELSKKLNELSGGTRQKINAVAAFMFNPVLMILDEPTAGLDPRSSSILKDRILAERRAGKTFVITSHVMTELEELADEVIFISEGRVRFNGSVRQIKDLTRQANLERAVAELMEEVSPHECDGFDPDQCMEGGQAASAQCRAKQVAPVLRGILSCSY